METTRINNIVIMVLSFVYILMIGFVYTYIPRIALASEGKYGSIAVQGSLFKRLLPGEWVCLAEQATLLAKFNDGETWIINLEEKRGDLYQVLDVDAGCGSSLGEFVPLDDLCVLGSDWCTWTDIKLFLIGNLGDEEYDDLVYGVEEYLGREGHEEVAPTLNSLQCLDIYNKKDVTVEEARLYCDQCLDGLDEGLRETIKEEIMARAIENEMGLANH